MPHDILLFNTGKVSHDPTVQLASDPSHIIGQGVGSLFDVIMQLPKMVIEILMELITNPFGFFESIAEMFPLLDLAGLNFDGMFGWLEGIPFIGDIVEAITGLLGGDLDDLFNFFLTVPTLLGGFLSAGIIPGLDASKIISGFFPMTMITGLLDALSDIPIIGDIIGPIVEAITGITGGDLGDLTGFFTNIPFLSDLVEAITGSAGGLGDLTSFFDDIPFIGDIVEAITGGFGDFGDLTTFFTLIPTLISGFLPTGIIPGLDASKIISGSFPMAMISGLLGILDGFPFIGDLVAALTGSFGDLSDLDSWADTIPLLLGGLIPGSLIPTLDPTKILNLPGLFGDVVSGFENMFNGWFGGSSAVGVPAEVTYVIESMREAVLNGFTVITFTTNGTWTVPASLVECVFICIGGGGRGVAGGVGPASLSSDLSVNGGAGGLDGGYLAMNIDPATLTAGASVSVTIGMGATTAGTPGGVTHVGSAESTPGVGAMTTAYGYSPSSSKPGSGGRGGNAHFDHGGTTGTTVITYDTSVVGGSSALGLGGSPAAGSTTTGTTPGTAGGNGETVSLLPETKSGGGGGGGGGARGRVSGFSASVTGGAGGAGGYPGGGSGGGGAAVIGGSFNTVNAGAPGITPNGCAFIMYKAA